MKMLKGHHGGWHLSTCPGRTFPAVMGAGGTAASDRPGGSAYCQLLGRDCKTITGMDKSGTSTNARDGDAVSGCQKIDIYARGALKDANGREGVTSLDASSRHRRSEMQTSKASVNIREGVSTESASGLAR